MLKAILNFWDNMRVTQNQFGCYRKEIAIEFYGQFNKKSCIWLYQPDGDTKLEYTYHLSNKLSESKLREFEASEDKELKTHQLKRQERDFPFFERLYSRCEGYTNDNGESLTVYSKAEQIAHLEKWFPEHIESAIIHLFDKELYGYDSKKKE